MAQSARSDRRPPPVDTARQPRPQELIDVALSPVPQAQDGGAAGSVGANRQASPPAPQAPLESRNAYGITNRLTWTSWAYLALLVLIFIYWWVVVDFYTALVLPFLLVPLAFVLVWWFRNRHITPLDAVISCFARGFSPYGALTFMFEVAVGLFTTLFTGHFLSLPKADTFLAVFIFAIWGALATFEEYIKYRLVLQTERSPALRSPPGKEKLIISTAQTTGFATGLTIFTCLLYSIIRTAFADSAAKTGASGGYYAGSQASAVFTLAAVLTVISVPVHCLTGYLISLRVVLRDQINANNAAAAAAVARARIGAEAERAASPASLGSPAAAAVSPRSPNANARLPPHISAERGVDLIGPAMQRPQPTARMLLLPSVLRSLLMLHILLALSGAYGTVGSALFFVALTLPALLVAGVLMIVVRATEKELPPDYLRRVGSLTFTYARLLGDEEEAADLPPYSPGFVELARAERRRADEARAQAQQSREAGHRPQLPVGDGGMGVGDEVRSPRAGGQSSSSLGRMEV